MEGNQSLEVLKPIDKVSLGEITSHRAVTTVNANVASKQLAPRAEPTAVGRRQHGMPKSDRCGIPPRRGVSDSTVTRTRRVAGEASLVPVRNHRSKVDRITGQTGKSIEGERVADGSVVATKWGNAHGARGPCCSVTSLSIGKARTR
jgi:hypothetical protein